MKLRTLTLGTLALGLGASLAHADETQYGRLAYAAHDLAYASQEFTKTVRQAMPGSPLANDAETLFDSAEHFQEEVDLGPQDLDVDFDTIESVFDQVRAEFQAAPGVQAIQPVVTGWFETEEANVRLRQAWSTSGFQTTPGALFQCTATNSAGQTFQGISHTQSDAQDVAMEYCHASQAASSCQPGVCAPYNH